MRTPGRAGLPDPLAAGLAFRGLPGLAVGLISPLHKLDGAIKISAGNLLLEIPLLHLIVFSLG